MPVVPTLNEGQRIEQRSPVQAVDPNDYTNYAKGIQQAGAGIQALGAGYVEYAKEKNKVKQKIDVALFREEMERKALEIEDKSIRTGKSDGSDLNYSFNAEFDDIYKSGLEQIDDPLVKKSAQAEAVNIRNTFNKRLFENSRTKFVEDSTRKSEDLQNQLTAGVQAAPEAYDDYVKKGYENLKRMEGVWSAETIAKAQSQFGDDLARSQINGFTQKKQYNEARQALVTHHAGRFTPKQREEILDKIDREEVQAVNLSWQTLQRNEIMQKRDIEEKQNRNFKDIFNRQASGQTVEVEANEIFGAGMLRKDQWDLLQRQETKVDEQTSKGTYFNLLLRATGDKEIPSTLMKETSNLRRKGVLNNDDANSLLKFLFDLEDKKKDSAFADPAFKALKSAHVDRIEKQFNTEPGLLGQFTKQQDAQRAASAKEFYVRQVFFNGMNTKEKMDQALRQTFKQFGGPSITISDVPAIPGMTPYEYNDPKNLDSAKKNLLKNKSKMSPKEYSDSLRSLKKLQDYHDQKGKWESWESVVTQ